MPISNAGKGEGYDVVNLVCFPNQLKPNLCRKSALLKDKALEQSFPHANRSSVAPAAQQSEHAKASEKSNGRLGNDSHCDKSSCTNLIVRKI